MATTSIGNTPGGSIADLVLELKNDLANGLVASQLTGPQKAITDGPKHVNGVGQPVQTPPPASVAATDVASVLFAEVATTDLTKLTSILNPPADPTNNKVLDSLLRLAVQEVAKGNDERAVGYLADYATRDPFRAEALPLQPELQPVRDKIDSMVSRMAQVAKMSAEDGLSRAEQTASDVAGKLPSWDTSADVLVKLAHRLFDAGGYANYSRTAELARVVSDAGTQSKPIDQALAAAAAATVSAPISNQSINQMIPGINVPYWVSPDFQVTRPDNAKRSTAPTKTTTNTIEEIGRNLRDLKEISFAAVRQLWMRAPLLVMMLGYFAIGLCGGIAFAIGSRIWPDGTFVALGNIAFGLWAIGFLALVGFSFYARVKDSFRRY